MFPFVPIYWLITRIRNLLYDHHLLKSEQFNIPVICVGNLSTGGTGKTPMIEYLIRLIEPLKSTAVLSRGYKRHTKGFVLAKADSTVEDIGDEPFQFHSKFPTVTIAVDEQRVRGIRKLMDRARPPKVVLLDDAFQHRQVKAGLNILLSSYQAPFYSGMVLPTGDLREPRAGYMRADIIIITKCPAGLSENEKASIKKQIGPLDGQQVFFSTINYSRHIKNNQQTLALDSLGHFTLVTGIANPQPLVQHLKRIGLSFEHLIFKDHHHFSDQELEELGKRALIVTTEKDFARLRENSALDQKRLFYLEIEFVLDRPDDFEALISKAIKQ